jgi:hypothetical protein
MSHLLFVVLFILFRAEPMGNEFSTEFSPCETVNLVVYSMAHSDLSITVFYEGAVVDEITTQTTHQTRAYIYPQGGLKDKVTIVSEDRLFYVEGSCWDTEPYRIHLPIAIGGK